MSNWTVSDFRTKGMNAQTGLKAAYESIESKASTVLNKNAWNDATGKRLKGEVLEIIQDCKNSDTIFASMVDDACNMDLDSIFNGLEKIMNDLEG